MEHGWSHILDGHKGDLRLFLPCMREVCMVIVSEHWGTKWSAVVFTGNEPAHLYKSCGRKQWLIQMINQLVAIRTPTAVSATHRKKPSSPQRAASIQENRNAHIKEVMPAGSKGFFKG